MSSGMAGIIPNPASAPKPYKTALNPPRRPHPGAGMMEEDGNFFVLAGVYIMEAFPGELSQETPSFTSLDFLPGRAYCFFIRDDRARAREGC